MTGKQTSKNSTICCLKSEIQDIRIYNPFTQKLGIFFKTIIVVYIELIKVVKIIPKLPYYVFFKWDNIFLIQFVKKRINAYLA